MNSSTAGIHHITAIAADPVKTVDFYTRVLGLRLVKKSVNQDDVATYHLFFGDQTGEPGMDLTFFTFQPTFPGRPGSGQVTTISLAVPEVALSFWQSRFEENEIKFEPSHFEWGKQRLTFFDYDDQKYELVGVPEIENDQAYFPWTTADISHQQAIRCFHAATLSVSRLEQIEPILTEGLGYSLIAEKNDRKLFGLSNSNRVAELEVIVDPTANSGSTGAGTVHHIAFRVRDEDHQAEIRNQMIKLGMQPTPVIDRFYFKSVYFRTPAGILFELATDGPGFTADEAESELGQKLALPPFLEPRRKQIEAGLVPL